MINDTTSAVKDTIEEYLAYLEELDFKNVFMDSHPEIEEDHSGIHFSKKFFENPGTIYRIECVLCDGGVASRYYGISPRISKKDSDEIVTFEGCTECLCTNKCDVSLKSILQGHIHIVKMLNIRGGF